MTETLTPEQASRLVVLSGPTAVGKGTVINELRRSHPEILISVSATTRPARPGEVDGVHYHFVDDAAFDRLLATDSLVEWAVVHNKSRYGTPRDPVVEAVRAGRTVLCELDIQGARQVRATWPGARFVFLSPPSWEEMVRRLTGRGTESPAEQQRRLETAKVELAAQAEFDAVIVNREVSKTCADLVALLGL